MCNNKENLKNPNTSDKNKFNNLNRDTKYCIAIVIFSLSLLISAIILSNSIQNLKYSFNNSFHMISSDISDLPDLLITNFSHLVKEPKDISQHTLSIQDAATYLGIAPDELWKVVNDPESKIPHFQVGKSRCFFTKEGLDKWLEGTYTLNFDTN
ncbi:helix-turn-helix domain-containing protein [Clostridium weizhouense]|uniref:Helix-turn-helix domain-containing protein n=1 Tax=Clostridium weizhouense TaxID=2859781 RepID=A0ABS7AQU8_9CLOT|nr:helix-turn-helix domain-containing protein [Clostridium weizhouense]MBW6410056.1 helix-turn-helix domain-containing protein [Clostridium weizhouense]